MSEIDPNLCIDNTVFVAASRFGENSDDIWFVSQFGIEANTKELIWYVVCHRAGRWKVHILFDDTYCTLKTAAFKHTVGNYPQCAP